MSGITSITQNLINTLSPKYKLAAKYIGLHEAGGSLANVRFAQDTIVNWAPKTILARSLTDFADMSFLEFSESLLVYYGPKFLGENIFRKLYSKKLDKCLTEKIGIRAENLLNDRDAKKLMPVKAAISISALAIPLAEYSLNYIKNILTLKVFKQADFNNIANLNKDKREDAEKQQEVKDSAIKHLKLAGGLLAGCLGLSVLLATRGKNSKVLQSFSEAILAPGNKIFKNEEKAAKFNKYFSIDFDSKDVKDKFGKLVKDEFGNTKKTLALSKGQLVACVIAGFFGYTGAAKDRGKQNLLEVLFRYPIVTFYVITGSELFEKGFKKILKKTGKCKEILDEEELKNEMPKLEKLSELAKKLAIKNNTSVESEFQKLFKQKTAIIGVPLLFSLVVMGMFVAGVSRFFTQYRYNNEMEHKELGLQFGQKSVDKFKKKIMS